MSSSNVVVVGCGYLDIARPLLALEKLHHLKWLGWIDDNPDYHGRIFCGKPVIGSIIDVLERHPNYYFVNSVGLSAIRRRAVNEKLEPFSDRTIAVIHPTVDTDFCVISEGVVISAGVHLEPNTFINSNTMILPGCTIGHDCHIGRDCFIGPGVHICGTVEIGDYSWIGAGTVIHPGSKLGAYSVTSQGANIMSKYSSSHGVFYEPPTKNRGK
tara:strand:+ start:145 stop:783 length:639 start_codon:yes stop_codon:yes gene_type:complete